MYIALKINRGNVTLNDLKPKFEKLEDHRWVAELGLQLANDFGLEVRRINVPIVVLLEHPKCEDVAEAVDQLSDDVSSEEIDSSNSTFSVFISDSITTNPEAVNQLPNKLRNEEHDLLRSTPSTVTSNLASSNSTTSGPKATSWIPLSLETSNSDGCEVVEMMPDIAAAQSGASRRSRPLPELTTTEPV